MHGLEIIDGNRLQIAFGRFDAGVAQNLRELAEVTPVSQVTRRKA
jgi:hypothetical protein